MIVSHVSLMLIAIKLIIVIVTINNTHKYTHITHTHTHTFNEIIQRWYGLLSVCKISICIAYLT